MSSLSGLYRVTNKKYRAVLVAGEWHQLQRTFNFSKTMYTLKRSIVVNTTLEEAWDFISRPQNLNLITPDDMEFKILSEVPEEMYNGLIIKYLVKIPLMGSQEWVSEIKHIRDYHSFVDEQRIGPYQLWYHYHEIRQVEGGIQFVDEVNYEVPYGIFGKIAHGVFIGRTLDRIFNYRNERFKELLDRSLEIA